MKFLSFARHSPLAVWCGLVPNQPMGWGLGTPVVDHELELDCARAQPGHLDKVQTLIP